jgi:hypothetical protein
VPYSMRHPHAAPVLNLPAPIQTALDTGGILWRRVSEGSRSRRGYETTVDSVTGSTAQGLSGQGYVAKIGQRRGLSFHSPDLLQCSGRCPVKTADSLPRSEGRSTTHLAWLSGVWVCAVGA